MILPGGDSVRIFVFYWILRVVLGAMSFFPFFRVPFVSSFFSSEFLTYLVAQGMNISCGVCFFLFGVWRFFLSFSLGDVISPGVLNIL